MHATLQASLRAALRGRRDVESIGPFLAGFDADDDSPFRNYAIPGRGWLPRRLGGRRKQRPLAITRPDAWLRARGGRPAGRWRSAPVRAPRSPVTMRRVG